VISLKIELFEYLPEALRKFRIFFVGQAITMLRFEVRTSWVQS
jgi:hypothetical protein